MSKKEKIVLDVMSHAFYSNVDPRRRQELKDSQMIGEDHNAMANLPTEPIHREYNQNSFNVSTMFDDEV